MGPIVIKKLTEGGGDRGSEMSNDRLSDPIMSMWLRGCVGFCQFCEIYVAKESEIAGNGKWLQSHTGREHQPRAKNSQHLVDTILQYIIYP